MYVLNMVVKTMFHFHDKMVQKLDSAKKKELAADKAWNCSIVS